MARARRPVGEITRGKTHPNRLRRLDLFLLRVEHALLARRDGVFADAPLVDVGYGRLPWTTAQWARATWRQYPDLPFVGLEIDPERVAAAAPFAGPMMRFARGGFDVAGLRGARVIRALNVLRQYEEHEVAPAWALMGDALAPGGLLVEGTCCELGRTMVVNLLRRTSDGLVPEGLLFSTNFRDPHAPADFQPRLPKNYIHRAVPGEPIFTFLQDWGQATTVARARAPFGARQAFALAGRALAKRVPGVVAHPWLLRHGYLWWRQQPPV